MALDQSRGVDGEVVVDIGVGLVAIIVVALLLQRTRADERGAKP